MLITPTQSPEMLRQLQAESESLRRDCLKSLALTTQVLWPIIEPATPYIHGWHITAICDHLEAASRFEIKRLMINMPPRHMKSILVNVMFPLWVWLHNPERRFICASYSRDLAIRDGLKMRTIIENPFFQNLFRPTWKLRDDQNQKLKFENDKTGFRLSTSVEGQATGEGGDFLIVDDPLNAMEANSEPAREGAIRWLDTVMSTRANNAKRNCRIMVMQRLHENDPAGHITRKKDQHGAYEKLILQARYESKPRVKSETSLGFLDPRRKDGELLWPARFDEASLRELEADLQDQAHAQLQQDPKPRGGGTFKREWWKRFDKSPAQILETVQFWDCAQKPGITNDWSVCTTWARGAAGFFLLDVWRAKVDAPTLEAMSKALYQKWVPDAIVIEDKSAGSSLIQYLLKETALPVLPYNPKGDKEVRAIASTPTVQAGKCHLPSNPIMGEDEVGNPINLIETFIVEHETFPKGGHDDMVDTTSMMVDWFNKRSSLTPRIRSL